MKNEQDHENMPDILLEADMTAREKDRLFNALKRVEREIKAQIGVVKDTKKTAGLIRNAIIVGLLEIRRMMKEDAKSEASRARDNERQMKKILKEIEGLKKTADEIKDISKKALDPPRIKIGEKPGGFVVQQIQKAMNKAVKKSSK